MKEKVLKLISEAQRAFATADHLAFVTYPLLQDPKLLLSIVQNVERAMMNSMSALLHVDAYYRRIQVVPLDVQARLRIFEGHTAKRYKVRKEMPEMLREVRGVLQKHAESPVEFVRNGRLVICDDEFRMRTLEMSRVKAYVAETRQLMQVLEGVKRNV